MSEFEKDYLQLLREVKYGGSYRDSRAGRTVSKFGIMLRDHSLRSRLFPLVTTRKIYHKPVLGELAAFINGTSELVDFKAVGCNYWDMNAAQWPRNQGLDINQMSVGRIYGVQWNDWNGVYNQLEGLVQGIKGNPFGRRHLLTTWNPSELDDMCLPPCHVLAQAYVTNDRHLDLCVYMRSVDLCLGLPSDVVLYSSFLVALATEVGLAPGSITWMLGDAHIYENHLPLLEEQLHREPYPLPRYDYDGTDFMSFMPESLEILDYQHHDPIVYRLN